MIKPANISFFTTLEILPLFKILKTLIKSPMKSHSSIILLNPHPNYLITNSSFHKINSTPLLIIVLNNYPIIKTVKSLNKKKTLINLFLKLSLTIINLSHFKNCKIKVTFIQKVKITLFEINNNIKISLLNNFITIFYNIK
jgi:hypothetical protein